MNNFFCSLPVTAGFTALRLFSPSCDDATLIPSQHYALEQPGDCHSKYSWEDFAANPYYTVGDNASKDVKHFLIIQEFATKLVSNMKDNDPEIESVISKRFWDLL